MGLDPSAISDDTRIAGRVNGTVDVDVTLRDYPNGVTPESIDVSGRVDMSQSTIGGIDIDTAAVNGMYQDRSGNLTELVVDGPDIHVKGQGPIALNDTGSSNLVLHVETPSLDRLGRVFGQNDLKGAATVDATVTGNGQELKASGMSACLASGVVRGSITTSVAPRRWASRMCETRWMPDVEGFAPHRMMSRDSGKSA